MKNQKNVAMMLSLLLCAVVMNSQVVVLSECVGTFETEVPSDIQPTSDGGFIIVGMCQPIDGIVSPTSHGGLDYYVAKLNSSGGMDWQHNYGGTHDEVARGIAELPTGEFVIIGESYSNDGDVQEHNGSTLFSDIWCIRISPTGDLLWSKSFGTDGNDAGADILYKNPNRLILGGTKKVEGSGVGSIPYNTDIWIAELDLNGNVLSESYYGDDYKQELFDMIRTPDDDLFIAGTTYTAGENEGDGSAMLTKIDGNGDEDWSISFDSEGFNGIGKSAKICQDADENIIMGFQTSLLNDEVNCNPHGSFHFVSVSENGELLIQKCFGGGGIDQSIAACMTGDGQIWILGTTTSDDGDVSELPFEDNGGNAWLASLDEDMNITWKTTLGGSKVDGAVDMCVQNGSIIFVLGYTNSDDGVVEGLHNEYGDYQDNWVVKVDTEQTSVVEKNDIQIGIYPNPASESIRVEVPNTQENYYFRIFDQTGSLAQEGWINTTSHEIMLDGISSGIYQLMLSDTHGRMRGSGRLVKS